MDIRQLVTERVEELGGNVVVIDNGLVLWGTNKRTSNGDVTVFNVHHFTTIDGKADLYWGRYDMNLVCAALTLEEKLKKVA